MTGTNVCEQCPVGSWSGRGATTCNACPAGQYAFNHLICKDCPGGKYSEGARDNCIPCGKGEVAKKKSSSCTVCLTGQYANHNDNKCKPCKKGTYSLGSADSCTTCLKGTYSGSGESQCHSCIPGQYFDLTLLTCVDCKPSYYSTRPDIECQKCPCNTYSGFADTSCHVCPAGSLVNAAQSGCGSSPTPPPTFAPSISSRSCLLGQYNDPLLQKCVDCDPGYFTISSTQPCSKCPHGYYSPPNAVFSLPYGTCKACAEVQTPDKTECIHCPPGYLKKIYYTGSDPYSSEPEPKCVKCAAGTYTGFNFSSCAICGPRLKVKVDQSGCDLLYCYGDLAYSPDERSCIVISPTPTAAPSFFDYTKTTCIAGQYEDPITRNCVSCLPSFYSPFPSQPCKKCPFGLYSSLQGEESCHECSTGLVANALQTGCELATPPPTPVPTPSSTLNCPAGNYYDPLLVKCVTCKAGYYTQNSTTPCQACPSGYYSKLGATKCIFCPGVLGYAATECFNCTRGYIIRNNNCVSCPSGTYAPRNTRECLFCPINYRPSPDQEGCMPTTPSASPTIFDATQCKPGSAAYYDNYSSYKYCRPCDEGYYSASPPNKCALCPTGKVAEFSGSTACHGCPEGTVASTGYYRVRCV